MEGLPEWKRIKPVFDKWNDILENQVTFTLEDSEKHTGAHCRRVMLYALAIAQRQGLSEKDKDALGAAAAFHDSRRLDDWLDVGHGQRAADAYADYCKNHGFEYDRRTYAVIAYHDCSDEAGKKAITDKNLEHGLLLYEIFKDADALDRFRLAANGLDIKYLRTEEAKGLMAFAKNLIGQMQGIKPVDTPDRYLIVVDMQNDFITGALGTKEAEYMVNAAAKKAREYPGHVFFSMDTHTEDYLSTQEGKLLPIKHCVAGTKGWQLVQELAKVQAERNGAVYDKPAFASLRLAEDLKAIHKERPIKEIELIGLCTDVCVISNALLLKAYMPEVPIYVDASCCAGTTPDKHRAALQTMESCHIMQRQHDRDFEEAVEHGAV